MKAEVQEVINHIKKSLRLLSEKKNIRDSRIRLEELETITNSSDFWSDLNNAKIVGYACIIDRSNSKSEIRGKIVSQVKLNIPTYSKDNLPKELLSLEPVKPGSRNL